MAGQNTMGPVDGTRAIERVLDGSCLERHGGPATNTPPANAGAYAKKSASEVTAVLPIFSTRTCGPPPAPALP